VLQCIYYAHMFLVLREHVLRRRVKDEQRKKREMMANFAGSADRQDAYLARRKEMLEGFGLDKVASTENDMVTQMDALIAQLEATIANDGRDVTIGIIGCGRIGLELLNLLLQVLLLPQMYGHTCTPPSLVHLHNRRTSGHSDLTRRAAVRHIHLGPHRRVHPEAGRAAALPSPRRQVLLRQRWRRGPLRFPDTLLPTDAPREGRCRHLRREGAQAAARGLLHVSRRRLGEGARYAPSRLSRRPRPSHSSLLRLVRCRPRCSGNDRLRARWPGCWAWPAF
jgi:hypothetical protein